MQLYDRDVKDQNPIEAVAVSSVLNTLIEGLGFSVLWERLSILSPYLANCKLRKHQLVSFYAEDREYIDHFEADVNLVVYTVASCQGLKGVLIIYRPGSGPMENIPVGRENI